MESLGAATLPAGGPDPEWGARVEEPLSPARRGSFDRVLGGAVAILGILTIVTLLPGERFGVVSGTLDVVLNTLTAVAAAGAAALAWVRYRVEREVAAVHESAAFLVLCVTRVIVIVITAFGSPDQLGMSLDQPRQWPLYAWSLARLASALLLVVAARSALRHSRRSLLPAWAVVTGSVVLLLVAFVALSALDAQLPPLMSASGFAALRGDRTAIGGMLPVGVALQLVIGGTYVLGAVLYRRLFRDRGRPDAGYLVLALVVAGFSQIQWAMAPGIYRPLVTVDDLLRALFSLILLMGIEAQFRGDVRALRAANAHLRTLGLRDMERATSEASARLAREVHDGLSQNLWLAKLAHSRLTSTRGLSREASDAADLLGDAIDRALGDARAVVASMRSDPSAVDLSDALRRNLGDFETRTGVRVDVEGLGSLAPVEASQAREVLQIAQEALTNVGRHADATLVRVSALAGPSSIELTVADNGRGFDVAAERGDSFGLKGMRERAAAIGATLQIHSRPADGTRVVISLPLPKPDRREGGA